MKINQASQLLDFEDNFYQIERNLMSSSYMQDVSRQIYRQPNHAYAGDVSCLGAHSFKSKSILFAGNSNGYIRAFCTKTQKEQMPLFEERLSGREVACLDISLVGRLLIAAYKGGIVVLWDLMKFKLAHLMTEVARVTSSSSH